MKAWMGLLIITMLAGGCLAKQAPNLVGNGPSSGNNNGGDGGDGNNGNDSGDDDGGDNGGTNTPLPQPQTGSTTGSSNSLLCREEGVSDSSNYQVDYHPIPAIGAGNGTSAPQWSSATNLPSNFAPGILVSESRVHVRVLAKPAPAKDGGKCTQFNNYNKLSLKVSIRRHGSSSTLGTLSFNEIAKEECSEVLRFASIPANDPDKPFVLEIHDVMSDHECIPPNNPRNTAECPGMLMIRGRSDSKYHACWAIQLQVATDHTYDIPR